MKYPKEIYLKYDPFSGSDRDADIRCHTFSIVKTKKSHQCMLANMIAKSHTIKKGQLARYDKAIVDGQWGGYYSCLDCMDIWLSENWGIRSSCQLPTREEEKMGEEKLYIGSKLITAYPLDECSFLKNFKGQDVSSRDTRPGYLVKYPDGYKSWSPKETFEIAYREVTDSEKAMI